MSANFSLLHLIFLRDIAIIHCKLQSLILIPLRMIDPSFLEKKRNRKGIDRNGTNRIALLHKQCSFVLWKKFLNWTILCFFHFRIILFNFFISFFSASHLLYHSIQIILFSFFFFFCVDFPHIYSIYCRLFKN